MDVRSFLVAVTLSPQFNLDFPNERLLLKLAAISFDYILPHLADHFIEVNNNPSSVEAASSDSVKSQSESPTKSSCF